MFAEPDVVFKGHLGDLEALECLGVRCSPSNIWPADESWLIYTDWDLWGTKIYGPPELLSLIEADAFLETVRLPAYRHMFDPVETCGGLVEFSCRWAPAPPGLVVTGKHAVIERCNGGFVFVH